MANDYQVGMACLRDAHIKVLQTVGVAAPEPQWRDQAVEFARQYHRECSMDPARAFDLDALIHTIHQRYKHVVSQGARAQSRQMEASARGQISDELGESGESGGDNLADAIRREMAEDSDADEEVTSTPATERPVVARAPVETPAERPRPRYRRNVSQYTIEPTPPAHQQPMRAHQLAALGQGTVPESAGRKYTWKQVAVVGILGIGLGYLIYKISH